MRVLLKRRDFTKISKNGKKIGRPTDSPKLRRITVRLDAKRQAILDLYCEKNGVSVSDAVNTAIEYLAKKK